MDVSTHRLLLQSFPRTSWMMFRCGWRPSVHLLRRREPTLGHPLIDSSDGEDRHACAQLDWRGEAQRLVTDPATDGGLGEADAPRQRGYALEAGRCTSGAALLGEWCCFV